MTQTTLQMFDAHARDYEYEERRAYKSSVRKLRKRKPFGKRKRAVSLSINGRNRSRTTASASYMADLAGKMQMGDL